METSRTEFHAAINASNLVASVHAAQGGTNNIYLGATSTTKTRKPFSTVPFRRDPDFIDRPEIMTWLREQLSFPSSRAALVGLGGVGKSQLVIQYAHEIERQFQDTYVFWVYGATKERFIQSYHGIADALQLEGRNDPKADVPSLVYRWLCLENKHWFMVLNNADDITVFHPILGKGGRDSDSDGTQPTNGRSLAAFLPQSPNGKILITSRSQGAAEALTGNSFHVRTVPGMDEDQARELLRTKLRHINDEEVAGEIVKALEYMPLAITQAAAYIMRRFPRVSPAMYLKQFQTSDKNKTILLGRDMGDIRRDPGVSNAVFTTWQITYEQIQQERRSATELLSLLSFFHHQGIPEWILQCYYDRLKDIEPYNRLLQDSLDALGDDMEVLSGYCLVTQLEVPVLCSDSCSNGLQIPASPSLQCQMHALIQTCTRAWLGTSGTEKQWRRIFVQLLSGEHPDASFENRPMCAELSPHIEPLVIWEEDDPSEASDLVKLLEMSGLYHSKIGTLNQAEKLAARALNIAERTLGPGHRVTVSALTTWNGILEKMDKHPSVIPAADRSCQALLNLINAPSTNLAALESYQLEMGRLISNDRAQKQLANAYEPTLVSNQEPETLPIVVPAKGIERYGRILSFIESAAPCNVTFHMFRILINIARCLTILGKFTDAEHILGGFMERQLRYPDEDWKTAWLDPEGIWNQLETVLHAQGKYRELAAVALMRIQKELLGTTDSDLLDRYDSLAESMMAREEYPKAFKIYGFLLRTKERELGPENPAVLACLENVAQSLAAQCEYEDAKAYYHRLLELRKRVLGPEHPETLSTCVELAEIQSRLGEHKEAEILLLDVLRVRQKTSGSALRLKQTLIHLWDIYERQDEEVQCVEILHQLRKLPSDVAEGEYFAGMADQIDILRMRQEQIEEYHADMLFEIPDPLQADLGNEKDRAPKTVRYMIRYVPRTVSFRHQKATRQYIGKHDQRTQSRGNLPGKLLQGFFVVRLKRRSQNAKIGWKMGKGKKRRRRPGRWKNWKEMCKMLAQMTRRYVI